MITSLLCLAFPLLLIYAAWHDVSTMTIPNWVSIVLGIAFIPAGQPIPPPRDDKTLDMFDGVAP